VAPALDGVERPRRHERGVGDERRERKRQPAALREAGRLDESRQDGEHVDSPFTQLDGG
jgi:hypothetical protein